MQALELRAGLDADVLDQLPARVAVGRERVRLPAAAVQRQQPLRVQPLAQRVLGQQGIDLADDLLVAASARSASMASSAAVRRNASSRRISAPANGSSEMSASGSPRKSASACLAESPGPPRVASPTSRSNRSASTSSRSISSSYARPRVTISAPPSAARSLAQAPDVVLDHLRGARRRFLAPQPFDQALGGDEPVRLEAEHGQHRALLRTAERDRMVVDTRFEVSEEADPHAAAGVVLNVCDQPNHLL